MDEGKYIYCVINSDEEKDFNLLGIGDRGDKVDSIALNNVAVVVSDSPVMDYPVSRQNMLAHQKVLESLMVSYTVLPVKFGTVAKSSAEREVTNRIRLEVLEKRYDELHDLLKKMEGKAELGLKCLWTDMESIFTELVQQNSDIKIMKRKVARGHPIKMRDQRVTLGEKVKNALDRKREKEAARIVSALKPLCAAVEEGTVFGDNMVMNTSFLVLQEKSDEFDTAVNQISSEHNGRMKFKYVGPLAPINFVELTIVLE